MQKWTTVVEPTRWQTKLLVTDQEGNELLKASLPTAAGHPRALLTVLEGLALWAGEPLTAVMCAGPALPKRVDEALFGVGLVPVDSALVRFEVVVPARGRRRTLSGVGDFRQLRRLQRRWA